MTFTEWGKKKKKKKNYTASSYVAGTMSDPDLASMFAKGGKKKVVNGENKKFGDLFFFFLAQEKGHLAYLICISGKTFSFRQKHVSFCIVKSLSLWKTTMKTKRSNKAAKKQNE